MTAIISNPADQKKIRDAFQEISESLTRMDGERALIKSIKDDLAEAFKDTIPKKMIGKMAKTYHRKNFGKEVAEAEEFEVLYQNITGEKASEE